MFHRNWFTKLIAQYQSAVGGRSKAETKWQSRSGGICFTSPRRKSPPAVPLERFTVLLNRGFRFGANQIDFMLPLRPVQAFGRPSKDFGLPRPLTHRRTLT
jgi:hypothetical protein